MTIFLRNSLIFVGFVCAALSLLAIAQGAFDYRFGPTVVDLLAQWDGLANRVTGALDPIVDWCRAVLSSWFGWFDLHPYWKHIFFVTSLYYVRNIVNNLGNKNRWLNGLLLVLPAVGLAIFGSVAFGVLLLALPAASVIPPVLALTLFELLEASLTASFDRLPGQTFQQSLGYYLRETVGPRFVLAVIVIVVGFVATLVLPDEIEAQALVTLPIVYVFMLAVILLVRGGQLATNDRRDDESWLQRFWRSNSGSLGIVLGGVFAAAGLVTVADALGLVPLFA